MLWTACHDGDVDKAKEAVASGANCNWANGDFNVILLYKHTQAAYCNASCQ